MSPELPEVQAVALRVIDVLDELGVRYHLGGSYASSTHGIPRQTQDVDLVVALTQSDVADLVGRLGDAFYADQGSLMRAIESRSSGNLVHLDSGVKVDLFIAGDGAFDRQELERSRQLELPGGRRVWIKSPEDTVLRKLEWYRTGGETSDRQWTDIRGIIATQGHRLDHEYLSRWSESLGVDDLLEKAMSGVRN